MIRLLVFEPLKNICPTKSTNDLRMNSKKLSWVLHFIYLHQQFIVPIKYPWWTEIGSINWKLGIAFQMWEKSGSVNYFERYQYNNSCVHSFLKQVVILKWSWCWLFPVKKLIFCPSRCLLPVAGAPQTAVLVYWLFRVHTCC